MKKIKLKFIEEGRIEKLNENKLDQVEGGSDPFSQSLSNIEDNGGDGGGCWHSWTDYVYDLI